MTPRQWKALIAGQWAEAGEGEPRVSHDDRVQIARRWISRACYSFGSDPRAFALALGLHLLPTDDRECGGDEGYGDTIEYAWHRERRIRGLRILHAIAHHLLQRENWRHTHADAFLLTLELALPQVYVRALPVAEAVRDAVVPGELVAAWWELSRRMIEHRECA